MKPKVALLTGGFSGEAVISYKSAQTVQQNIDSDVYEVYLIDITREGWWYTNGSLKTPIDKNDFSLTISGEKILFDVAFICIHGTPGEDGRLQGYLDLLNIPYTSCGVTTSALTFNKRYTVAVAAFSGIAVAKSLHLFEAETLENLLQQLQLPLFVKPNNGGSSIGMSKVVDQKDLLSAIDKAFKEDDQVLVEEFIEGREFTIGVYKDNAKTIQTLPVTEVESKNFFFDFEAKYTAGKATETTPAMASEEILEKVRKTAAKVYAIFNCNGVVRMDFIYNESRKEAYLLEINTVPGQSAASLVPQQVRANNKTLKQFYGELLESALVKK